MTRTHFYICAIFFYLLNGLNAQEPFFKSNNVADEINGAYINKIFQADDGFVWLATTKGLYKYDGIELHRISRTSNREYSNVSSIFQDSTGLIWLGFANGNIATLKNDRFGLFEPEEGLPKARITDILADDNKNIWIATYGEGIYYFRDERLYLIDKEDGLNDEYIYDLEKDQDGNIWAASDGGIAVCSLHGGQKQVSNIGPKQGLPDIIVTCLARRKNIMFIGMQDKGVAAYDINNQNFLENLSFETWPFGPVNTLLPFHDYVWAGTANQGIIHISLPDAGYRQYTGDMDGNNMQRIGDLFRCDNDNIWIAEGKNLLLSTGEKLSFIQHHENQDFSNPLALLVDSEMNLWFSNSEGLFSMNTAFTGNEALSKYFDKKQTGDLNIMSLYEDPRGYIWAGTFGKGVYLLHPETGDYVRFTQEDGLINSNVLSIDGKDREVWFATLGGVEKCLITSSEPFDKKAYEFTGFTEEHGLGNNFVYCVRMDSKGNIWFGTDGNGLTKYNGETFTTYNESNGLKSNVIYSITEDINGHIWFSTADAGLYKYNGEVFENYGVKEGLRNLNISGLEAGQNGNILIAHDLGIDLLNPDHKSFSYYGEEVGIEEMNPNLNAIARDKEGNIWLGAQNGILRFRPPEDLTNDKPLTRITGLSVYLEPVPEGRRKFNWDENHISFSYIGLWYIAPEKVKYQVMLQGHDIDWMQTQNRFITYSNLSPGKYIFKVKSGIDANFRNAGLKTYEFTIGRPLWATLWFYMALAIALGAGIYFYVKFREQRLRRQEMLKKEKLEFEFQTLKNQVNPHFLFNSFSTLISLIEDDRKVAVEYVEKLSGFFRNILQYRDMEVITLKEELNIIRTYFFIQQKRYGKNLRYSIDIPPDHMHSLIPPLTLQMLVENAVKHNVISRNRPLEVKIHAVRDMLVVENNIQSRKSREVSTGVGLQNIRDRYRILTGKGIKIEDDQKTYRILLPVIKPR